MAELQALYDDDRRITVEPSVNHEVAVTVGNQEPVFVFAADLLRLVSEAANVADPNDDTRDLPDTLHERYAYVLREHVRFDIEGCSCGWGRAPTDKGKRYSRHVADHLVAVRDEELQRWKSAYDRAEAAERDATAEREFGYRLYRDVDRALTPVLGREPTDELGHGLASDVRVLADRYQAAVAKLAAVRIHADALRQWCYDEHASVTVAGAIVRDILAALNGQNGDADG